MLVVRNIHLLKDKSMASLLLGLFLGSIVGCSPTEDASPSSANTAMDSTSQNMPTAEVADMAQAELGSFGVDLSIRDLTVKPGDDFFRYASGLWLETFEIPADRSNHGAFIKLRDRSDERVRTIIDDLASREPVAGTIEQKIGDYYLSFMDIESINNKGIGPLRPGLARIEAISSVADLVNAFGNSSLEVTATPLDFGIGADRSDPDQHQLSVYVTGISLPDRDYYLQDNDRFTNLRQEFTAHIARMLDFADIQQSTAKAEAILALETQIAESLWPRAERRNRDKTYNPMSYADFKASYPGFDWDAYFTAVGIEQLDDLNVAYPSAMSPIIDLVTSVSLDDWKSYLSYHLISNNSSVLSEEIYDENFSFYSTALNGVPAQRERWERGVARVGSRNSLGEPIGQIYVNEHFPDSAKAQMEQLVENLRNALGQSIAGLAWMGEETKAEAKLKLESFRPKIAYPDVWEDKSAIEIDRGDLFANARNVREFNYLDTISRLGQPTDREEWGMTPQTVNAYYNPPFNEIVFPAAILQPPFFDPAADMAVNYGGIGAVIGHEMGHGFDDQGSKSDYQGIQRNWWTDQDRANFDEKTSALAAQYDQYEPVPGNFIDGNFTLGENIGDVGGISIAYRAYKMALNGAEAPIIDGLSGDQRFFLAYAQVFLSKIRDEALVARLKADPHSPGEFRTNGVVRNIDEWYEAFDVQPGDALYLPPEDRVRIW